MAWLGDLVATLHIWVIDRLEYGMAYTLNCAGCMPA